MTEDRKHGTAQPSAFDAGRGVRSVDGSLAMLGLYGVIAYLAVRRRREIGVRIALGANRAGVVRLVPGEPIVLIAFSLLVGRLCSAGGVARSGSLRFFLLAVWLSASLPA